MLWDSVDPYHVDVYMAGPDPGPPTPPSFLSHWGGAGHLYLLMGVLELSPGLLMAGSHRPALPSGSARVSSTGTQLASSGLRDQNDMWEYGSVSAAEKHDLPSPDSDAGTLHSCPGGLDQSLGESRGTWNSPF